jgi:hypothetical protein
MKKSNEKKSLHLSTETVRALVAGELTAIAGAWTTIPGCVGTVSFGCTLTTPRCTG